MTRASIQTGFSARDRNMGVGAKKTPSRRLKNDMSGSFPFFPFDHTVAQVDDPLGLVGDVPVVGDDDDGVSPGRGSCGTG